VAPAGNGLPNGLYSLLPAHHITIWGKTMFAKQDLAIGLQKSLGFS
jgi:hypothetical protein